MTSDEEQDRRLDENQAICSQIVALREAGASMMDLYRLRFGLWAEREEILDRLGLKTKDAEWLRPEGQLPSQREVGTDE